MATLQTIRSKGPLLVIVIGLALFAFIAGDAWKVLQPHQGRQDVGEVNGKTLSAQEYQTLVDEYAEVIKMTVVEDVRVNKIINSIFFIIFISYRIINQY